jgi:hypothetical protein
MQRKTSAVTYRIADNPKIICLQSNRASRIRLSHTLLVQFLGHRSSAAFNRTWGSGGGGFVYLGLFWLAALNCTVVRAQ